LHAKFLYILSLLELLLYRGINRGRQIVILMPTPSHASGQCVLHASSTSAGRRKLLGLICVVLCHLKPVTI
jgi:hypothetical protein